MTNKEDALRFFMPEGVAEAPEEEIKKAVLLIKDAGFQDKDEDIEKRAREIFEKLNLTKERVCAEDIYSFWVAEKSRYEDRNQPC